jgi:hypothetical protein
MANNFESTKTLFILYKAQQKRLGKKLGLAGMFPAFMISMLISGIATPKMNE